MVKAISNLYQKWRRRTLFAFVYGVCCIIFALFLFEFVYRTQLIDTYLPELRGFNPENDIKNGKNRKTVLIIGDSFTAGTMTYAGIMRKELPDYRIINSGISGTGVIQASIIAKRRFQKFKPSIFIYQIYVGNDLFDITYPVNWEKLSFLRNTYWMVSNHFRSIAFLNYRISQLRYFTKSENQNNSLKNVTPVETYGIDVTETFSPEKYTSRTIQYLQAEPTLIENQITVKGNRGKDYETFLRKLETLLSYCRQGECAAYVLIIPHCSQVDTHYLANMKRLRAVFKDEERMLTDEYPFIEKMHKRIKMPNLVLLNPIHVLRDKESQNISMYYQNDEHLTPAGQETIAAFVMEKVFENQLFHNW